MLGYKNPIETVVRDRRRIVLRGVAWEHLLVERVPIGGDEGTRCPLISIVGFGGWTGFKFLFAGRNAAGQDRIYAVYA
jgi:hypothetical protein